MSKSIRITKKQWAKYIDILRKLQDRAADEMAAFAELPQVKALTGWEYSQTLIDYGMALATKYGEGATAVVCDWYDAIAMAEGMDLIPAVPAKTATYSDIAKAVNGTLKTSQDPEMIGSAVGRWVKMAGVDTLMQNALRDGAEWAWIPQGETCAFCLTLASQGWQPASLKAIEDGHAEHIHANCDCTFAVRHTPDVDVEGYDPQKYLDMYENAEGNTSKERINSMRREFYDQNKEKINAQKRAAYEKMKERNSSAAEEVDV